MGDANAAWLLPVIDLRGGVPVRASGGHRGEYRPVTLNGAEVGAVKLAESYARRVGHRSLYVADLDAIEGRDGNQDVWARLVRHESRLWLDAGVRDLPSAEAVIAAGELQRLVIALESLTAWDEIPRIVQVCGREKCVFSLDLKHGVPISQTPMQPLEIVERVVAVGIGQLIVLDLAAVGMRSGPACVELIAEIHRRWPECVLISGGGVRGEEDVAALAQAGCAGVLVATVLMTNE